MSEQIKERVRELVEDPLKHAGFELADLSVSLYRNKATVRLFVYGERGVSLGDCSMLSSTIGETIDATDLFGAGYTLEISSPGLDRLLKNAKDFHYRRGETVTVAYRDEGHRQVTAKIVNGTADTVLFENESGQFSVPVSSIDWAKIVY